MYHHHVLRRTSSTTVAKFTMAALYEIEDGVQKDSKDPVQMVEDATGPSDPAVERRLVRKIDFRLIPILFTLYLCAFIDRYALL